MKLTITEIADNPITITVNYESLAEGMARADSMGLSNYRISMVREYLPTVVAVVQDNGDFMIWAE